MTQMNSLRFSSIQNGFFSTLNKRVNEYFKTNGISKHANLTMVLKTIFMLCLYLIPYTLVITGVFNSLGALFILCVLMGLGVAGIGLSVMHDANHGAYSNKLWVNNALGFTLNLIGGNSFNWKVQHNVLHHTFTNVHDADEDIAPSPIFRMSPDAKLYPIHRFQHIYAWFFYGLLTMIWVFRKDFVKLSRYQKDGLVKRQKTNATKEWIVLISTKLAYLAYTVALPMIVLDVLWWQVLIGFFTMHFIAGFILAIIFQPAHVIESAEYPAPDTAGSLKDVWAVHQLRTTSNFAKNDRLLTWYVGGLNYQVEHHLFPHICHVHYEKISKIVGETALEFGLPYNNEDTFLDALKSHGRQLKALGRPLRIA
jgi:linoleoyl-CoA desaturase